MHLLVYSFSRFQRYLKKQAINAASVRKGSNVANSADLTAHDPQSSVSDYLQIINHPMK